MYAPHGRSDAGLLFFMLARMVLLPQDQLSMPFMI